MKTLIESLFDKNLTEKEYKINPLSIASDWRFEKATAGTYVSALNDVFDSFDKKYISKYGPTKNEIKDYYDTKIKSLHSLEKEIKCLKMAYVIGTWSKNFVPTSTGFRQGVSIISNSNTPGIERGLNIGFATFEESGGLKLTVTVNNSTYGKTNTIWFTFKHRDN